VDEPKQENLLTAWWFWLCIALAGFFVYWFLAMPLEVTTGGFAEAVMVILLAASSTATLLLVAKKFNYRETPPGRIMTAIVVGFASWTVAETVWTGYYVSDLDPLPSWADVFWILGYAFVIAALVVNANSIRLRFSHAMFALWLVLSAVVALPVLSIQVLPLIAEDPSLDTLVAVAYPVLDVLLIVPALAILLKFRLGEIALPWGVLTLGFILTGIGDLWYAYADYNGTYGEAYNLTDLFLMLGYVAFILGGLLFLKLYGSETVRE